MGKLKSIQPLLRPLAPRISTHRDEEGHGRAVEPWRAWFNSAEWKRLRMDVLRRDRFTCQCGCGRSRGDTSKLVADHIIPHRGDPKLFWDPDNLQTLLKSPCHDQKKQAEEHQARLGPGGR